MFETTCYLCLQTVRAGRASSHSCRIAMEDHIDPAGDICPGPARADMRRVDQDDALREVGACVTRLHTQDDLAFALEEDGAFFELSPLIMSYD